MKYFSVYFLCFIFLLASNLSHAEDSLTVKQQLDRIIQEVSDLNKAVFNKSFDKNTLFTNKKNDTERFTSIDIRIYDLEKDIKNLTLRFEETLFKLDDISNNLKNIESELTNQIETKQTNLNKINNEVSNKVASESRLIKEENTLGKLIISDSKKLLSNVDSKKLDKENDQEKKIEDKGSEEIKNMLPEEQLQFALDQMRKKNFDKSKKILENFVIKFPENQLSGSAYFWLGKIYLFELNYRNAALVFGEGVQKFPNSIKSSEMYYELIKSLKEMNKINEACKTFFLFKESYTGDKFTKDPDKIMDNLNCKN